MRVKIAIILNYMNYSQTIQCVELLIEAQVDHVIVVDNNSKNDSFELLQKEFSSSSNVDIVYSEVNGGYAQGNNIGLKYVESRFGISKNNIIFIINPDSKATIKNVNALCSVIDKNKNSGMITAMINGTSKSVWRHLTPFRALIFNSWIVRWGLNKFGIREGGFYNVEKSKLLPVDVVMGAFFAIRQDTFKKINYFDENTFMYYEEEILYWKLKKYGYQNYLVTTASFVHEGRGSTNLSKVEFKKINDASRLYLLKKYYNVGNVYSMFTKFVNFFDNILLKLLRR